MYIDDTIQNKARIDQKIIASLWAITVLIFLSTTGCLANLGHDNPISQFFFYTLVPSFAFTTMLMIKFFFTYGRSPFCTIDHWFPWRNEKEYMWDNFDIEVLG